MHFSSLQNFQNYLLQSKLVEASQLQQCMVRLQSRGQSIDGLISELEAAHVLTPYQVTKLNKRDLDGLLLGKFKLLYRNASGSFARVFRGCSVNDGRMVGIKVLRSRWAEDPRKVILFKREGELGKRLKHKNIVPIYEVGSEGNQHYLTMEFVEGGNLRELLKARGKFSAFEATRYVLDPYPPTKSKDERRQFSRYRDIQPIREVDPSLPPAVTKIVDKLLRISPSERYQTPAAVATDLRAVLLSLAPATSNDDSVVVPIPKQFSPTVLCVEDRVRQQDSLREYFSKHGYRVLLLRVFDRALTRLRSDPPKGLVLMGETLGNDAKLLFDKAVSTCRPSGTAVVLVLSKGQTDLKETVADSDVSRVLYEHPVTLRSIRKALEDVWNKST